MPVFPFICVQRARRGERACRPSSTSQRELVTAIQQGPTAAARGKPLKPLAWAIMGEGQWWSSILNLDVKSEGELSVC